MNPTILTYNTPTSGEITKTIYEYEFKRLWKKNLDGNIANLFFGIFCLLIVVLTLIFEPDLFTGFFAGMGLIAFSTYFSRYLSYRTSKKKLKEIIEKDNSDLKLNSNDVIWEFTPDHFKFKNYKSEYKCIWSEITYCVLDDQFLYITASSRLNFILDKANVDEENLNKTIQYLEEKAQFKEI